MLNISLPFREKTVYLSDRWVSLCLFTLPETRNLKHKNTNTKTKPIMKKNYLLVLFALLTFALSINAQESTDQEETYNMTVTLPDGTSLIVNTNDVDEVTFSEGKLSVSGTSVNEIVQKIRQVLEEIGANKMSIDEAKAYIENLVKMVNTLQTQVAELADATMTNREYAVYAFDRTHMNEEAIRALKDRLEALESALQSASSCMCDPQQAAEALTMAKQALANSEDAMHLAYQNADNIAMVKVMTDENTTDIAQVKDVVDMTRAELYALRVRSDILGDSIASIKEQLDLGGNTYLIDVMNLLETKLEETNWRIENAEKVANQALNLATETRESLENLRQTAYALASTFEPKLKELEEEKAMLITTVNAQQNMINNLTTTVAAQDAKIATQNANIANLQHVISELMQRVEVLENK